MSECDVIERHRSDPDQRERLLTRLAAGESLASVAQDLAMPSRPMVCEWLWTDPDFAIAFRAARVRGADLLAEECLEIADGPAETAVDVANKRVRIDTRLKLMARWQRNADSDLAKAETRLDMSQLTDEQLAVLASIPVVTEPRRRPADRADAGRDRSPPSPRHPGEGRDPAFLPPPARPSTSPETRKPDPGLRRDDENEHTQSSSADATCSAVQDPVEDAAGRSPPASAAAPHRATAIATPAAAVAQPAPPRRAVAPHAHAALRPRAPVRTSIDPRAFERGRIDRTAHPIEDQLRE